MRSHEKPCNHVYAHIISATVLFLVSARAFVSGEPVATPELEAPKM